MFRAMVTVKNIWTKTRVVIVLRAIIALKKNKFQPRGKKMCADFEKKKKKGLEIGQIWTNVKKIFSSLPMFSETKSGF